MWNGCFSIWLIFSALHRRGLESTHSNSNIYHFVCVVLRFKRLADRIFDDNNITLLCSIQRHFHVGNLLDIHFHQIRMGKHIVCESGSCHQRHSPTRLSLLTRWFSIIKMDEKKIAQNSMKTVSDVKQRPWRRWKNKSFCTNNENAIDRQNYFKHAWRRGYIAMWRLLNSIHIILFSSSYSRSL